MTDPHKPLELNSLEDSLEDSLTPTHHLSRAERWTRQMLSVFYRAPYFSLALCMLITGGAALTGIQLKNHIRTKLQDLLPDHAPSVIASRSLSERLESVEMLVLTLKTGDFQRTQSILPLLQTRLEALEQIRRVRWRQDTQLIHQNALITFPTLDDLKTSYQDLQEEIRREVKARMKLFDDEETPSGEASLPQTEMQSFQAELSTQLESQEGISYTWGELESDDTLSKIGVQLRGLNIEYPEFFYNARYSTVGLKIYPTQPSDDLRFCQRLVKAVEDETRAVIKEQLGEVSSESIVQRIDLGGAYVSTMQQSKKIKSDMWGSTLASLGLLILTLLIAFRSLRGVICVLIPLIIGTLWTLGLTMLTIGSLNLITAFIFAVLLGLGIDFGIHFYGRFREERALGRDTFSAMERAHLSCGHASLLAAGTTSASFLALTLADFRGLSQFGGLAALGVLLCFFAVWIVLPIIVFIAERWVPLRLLGYRVQSIEEERATPSPLVKRLGRRVALFGIALGISGLALTPWVQPELNFNRLKAYPKPTPSDPEEEISSKALQYGTSRATSPTVIFAQSPEEARDLQRQLTSLADQPGSRIKSSQSLYSLIPEDQSERIIWARKLCRKLKRKYKLFKGDRLAGAQALLRHCKPSPFTTDELPEWVKAKFTDRRGVVGGFIFISPRGSSADGENALAFYDEMQQLKTLSGSAPQVAGRNMIWAEILIAMRYDGMLTFSVALIAVLMILGLLEGSWRGLLFVSTPLILGLGCTVGLMVILGIKINFFNLLALPTLIGMGVDDGVHMHHRYRELGPQSAGYIVRTTGRAALLTTLTTSIGFASLMLVDHRGLNSLGLLSVIGMTCALIATLTIVPALFNWWDQRQQQSV